MAFSAVNRARRIGVHAPFARTGMEAASYRCSKSGAAFEREAGQASWGGARNCKGRSSEVIAGDKAASIIAAARHALAIGLPLNRHVTIHWERAGVPDERAAEATGRFLKLAGDWLAKQGGRFAHAWVRENGDRKGSHVHILLHLPHGRTLGQMQRGWLKRVTGKGYRKGVIVTRRIAGMANASASAPAAYGVNLAEVVGYVLKGTCPNAAAALGLERLEPGGKVISKRTATSENIGKSARSRI